jgi:putative transposase
VRRLKQLEDENAKLKRLVVDLRLDRATLQDVLRKRALQEIVWAETGLG